MRSEKIGVQPSFKMALKPIPKKAYEIGGQALRDVELLMIDRGTVADIEFLPKKGVFTNIRSLVIFVNSPFRKKGAFTSISIDPQGLLPKNGRYKTVQSFTMDNILDQVADALKRLKDGECLSKWRASLFPADTALLAKPFRK